MAKSRKRQDSATASDSGTPAATLERNGADTRGSAPSGRNGQQHRDRIARRAYELYLARGGNHGSDWEDWLIAEREVLGNSEDERGE